MNVIRLTYRIIGTTEIEACWVSAARSAIRTVVRVVAVDNCTLLVRDKAVVGHLKGSCSKIWGAWFLHSLLLHHGYALPWLVFPVTHLGNEVTAKSRRAAVLLVSAAHGLERTRVRMSAFNNCVSSCCPGGKSS